MDHNNLKNGDTLLSGGRANSGNSSSDQKCIVKFEDYDNTSSTASTSKNVRGGSVYREAGLNDFTSFDERGRGFSNKEVRMAFVQKVYSILFAQLAVTTGFISVFIFAEDVQDWVLKHQEVFLLAFITYFVITMVLVCCPGCRRHHPTNLILLSVFTLCLSYIVGFISITYKTQSVFLAFGTCAICCLLITVFSFTTSIDFTKFAGYIFVSFICLMIFGLIMMFINAPILQKVYAGLGAFLFMLYLIFDTQLIMGGKQYEISPDEYILAALTLYSDIIQIFLFLLQLIGERR